MQIARLKNSFASIMAFGHIGGMNRSSHRKFIPAVAKEIVPMPLTMTAADMGVTFKSCPELYRACHPLFDGRQKPSVAEPVAEQLHSTMTPNSDIEPVTGPSLAFHQNGHFQQTLKQPEVVKPAKLFQAVPSLALPVAFTPVTGWTWEVAR
jgi:hypothetical protein